MRGVGQKHGRDGGPVKSRRWAFTIFKFDDERVIDTAVDMLRMLQDKPSIEMYQFQYERCPGATGSTDTTAGRLHIQGYIRYKNAIGMGTLKGDLRSQSAHCEPCKGAESDNLAYTSKTDSRVPDTHPWTYGEPQTGKGKRSDLSELTDYIKEGHSFEEIGAMFPEMVIKFSKGIRELMTVYAKEREEGDLSVRLYIGQPRCGKTWDAVHELREKVGVGNFYFKTANNKWFDGYHQQPGMFPLV